MMIGNFTPDPVQWMHVGVEGTIEPGEIKEFDDARGKHILTKYGSRGLVRMEFGDDPEVKKEESMRRWRNFWTDLITRHNQHNEDQKEKGNRYAKPTEELKRHAELLGLELLAPWTVEASTLDGRKAKLLEKQLEEERKEKQTLRKEMERLQKTVAELVSTVNNLQGGEGSAMES